MAKQLTTQDKEVILKAFLTKVFIRKAKKSNGKKESPEEGQEKRAAVEDTRQP